MKKSVQFFGCGNVAKEFYQVYKDQLSIDYAISNNLKEEIFIPKEGEVYEVKRPKVKGKEEYFIIICSNDYDNIAEQLILLGYLPFVDFIDYELASVFLEGKKLILLYGSCHLRGIKDCLKKVDKFVLEYEPVYYTNYLYQNAYQQMRLNYLIDHCCVFVYDMAVTPENHRKNEAILGRFKPEVKRMCLPTVYFGAYFPQKVRKYNDMNPYAVKCENYDYTPFSYGDSWLNECIEKGMSSYDILDFIEKEPIYESDFVLNYLEGEWKRIAFQEKVCDFNILDYIKENFQKVRLFRNETHMENHVLCKYTSQLLERLGFSFLLPKLNEPLLICSQHCIYPSVAKVLGLEWNVMTEKLELYTYNGWEKLSFVEYINMYVEICSDIRILKRRHILP